MATTNTITGVFNLSRDPEFRELSSGAKKCELSLVSNRSYKDRNDDWKEEACFVDGTAWSGQASAVEKVGLRKGDPVHIEGTLAQDRWEDKDGNKRSKHYILISKITFIHSRRSDDSRSGRRDDNHRDARRDARRDDDRGRRDDDRRGESSSRLGRSW